MANSKKTVTQAVRSVNPAPAPRRRSNGVVATPWARTKNGMTLTDFDSETKLSVVPLPKKEGRWYIEVRPIGARAKANGAGIEGYIGDGSNIVQDQGHSLVWDDELEAMKSAEKAIGKLSKSSNPGRAHGPFIQREGKLGGAGYSKRTEAQRHALLMKCVNEYGHQSCAQSLQVLLNMSELHPKTRKVIESDKRWLASMKGKMMEGNTQMMFMNPKPASTLEDWEHERTELQLHIDHTYRLQKMRGAIEENLSKKMAKGKYDPEKAPKAWLYLIDAGAKDYAKEFGGDIRQMFPKKLVREPLSVEYARGFESEYKIQQGNPDIDWSKFEGPKWLGTIGDVNPLEYGGGIVGENEYGVFLTYFEPGDEEGEAVYVYNVFIEDDVFGDLDWANWEAVASSSGVSLKELKAEARSADPVARARAYYDVVSYEGWGHAGVTPERLTADEAEEEYGWQVDAAMKAKPSSKSQNPVLKIKNRVLR